MTKLKPIPIHINDNPTYTKPPIEEFQGNPLIESLNPPANKKEISKLLLRLPKFDPEERTISSSYRMFLPIRLSNFLYPTKDHYEIYRMIYIQIFTGYLYRNPITPAGQRFLYDYPQAPTINPVRHQPSRIMFITGLSGIGKTALIRSILRCLGKAVIRHINYQGHPFTESQIVYLMRNVPSQKTLKAFVREYGEATDELLNEKLYAKSFKGSNTSKSEFSSQFRKIIKAHHLGLLIIDDFHNLSVSDRNCNEILSEIFKFREEMQLPVILIGTYKADKIFTKEFSTNRRFIEGGFYDLERPSSSKNKFWRNLCKHTWKYQWVKKPIPIDDKIIDTLYKFSQGITGIMLNLFILSQIEAIYREIETVDVSLLTKVYKIKFKPLHRILDILEKDHDKYKHDFDDLYLKGWQKMAEQDPLVNSVQELQKQNNQKKDLEIGIIDTESNLNKKSCNKGYTINELHDKVFGE
jgi:hypothetical protein